MITSLKDVFNKKVAIWGFGAVGKAAAHLFSGHPQLTLLEQRALTPEESALVQGYGMTIAQDPATILAQSDLIIPSPGIDLRPYNAYASAFLSELDIMHAAQCGPTIAITGSAGKTTTTYQFAESLKKNHSVFLGGNIGHAMLYGIDDPADYRVLEVSSFQLEHTHSFAPDLAIITSFFPNHLDRHATIEDYRRIKLSIMARQQPHQNALIPVELVPYAKEFYYQGQLAAFSLIRPAHYTSDIPLYFAENNGIYRLVQGHITCIVPRKPCNGFMLNWIITAAALDIMHKPIGNLAVPRSPILEHRLEFCGQHEGINYYNDSKATIMESTRAALKELGDKTILLLGGLSKGIDRQESTMALKNSVKQIVCFGAEAERLAHFASQANIPSLAFASLEDAFSHARLCADPGDTILLSPGGSSFDLFKDYKERGEFFKKLVKDVKNQ